MTDMKFSSIWNIWAHDVYNKDWSLQSYKHIMKIENVGDMWSFLNNIKEFNYMKTHFFIMRDNIKPIWEDDQNRNGGTCKFKFDNDALDAWEEFVIHTLNEDIVSNFNTINGVSFNPKNSCTIIKIWNSKNKDVQDTLNPKLKDKYKDISIKYDSNQPEY